MLRIEIQRRAGRIEKDRKGGRLAEGRVIPLAEVRRRAPALENGRDHIALRHPRDHLRHFRRKNGGGIEDHRARFAPVQRPLVARKKRVIGDRPSALRYVVARLEVDRIIQEASPAPGGGRPPEPAITVGVKVLRSLRAGDRAAEKILAFLRESSSACFQDADADPERGELERQGQAGGPCTDDAKVERELGPVFDLAACIENHAAPAPQKRAGARPLRISPPRRSIEYRLGNNFGTEMCKPNGDSQTANRCRAPVGKRKFNLPGDGAAMPRRPIARAQTIPLLRPDFGADARPGPAKDSASSGPPTPKGQFKVPCEADWNLCRIPGRAIPERREHHRPMLVEVKFGPSTEFAPIHSTAASSTVHGREALATSGTQRCWPSRIRTTGLIPI